MTMQDRIVVVTGAGQGIGRASAERFATEGATVVVADLDQTTATEVANAITEAGGNAIAVPVDVAPEGSATV